MSPLSLSLGRVAVRYPGAHEPKMPNVSKFRATKPGIEDADVHVRFAPQKRPFAPTARYTFRAESLWHKALHSRCNYPSAD
jgi:hypothetical protein